MVNASTLRRINKKADPLFGFTINGYYFLFALLLIIVAPLLLFKKKARAGFRQKLGCVPEAIKAKKAKLAGCLWFHAVSVGEFNAVLPLLKAYHRKHPSEPLVVSTTTATGQALAQEKCQGMADVFYFPYDLPFATRPWLDVLKPSLVAIAETEIWPGFTYECSKRNIPMVVVNGRISPRSFKGYHRFRAFFGPVLRSMHTIGVQTEEEANRYRAIAGADMNVKVLGNLKFDGLVPVSSERRQELQKLTNIFKAVQTDGGDTKSSITIVAGSTHEGEESALLSFLDRVWSLDASLAERIRLIIVPRHPERFEHVASLIKSQGYTVRRYSRSESFSNVAKEVYLLDAIGKLFEFYSLCDLAFVGGTLAPIGGHNIMEPYAYAVPVLVGPHIEKTRDTANSLLEASALTICQDASSLVDNLIKLIRDLEHSRQLGERGQAVLTASQGAVQHAVGLIESVLEPGLDPVLER
ncbi:MAG: 3-deoxy-D-manno-octulosonic acid transferase [Candidatus Melainabacteria bacterium]|nr:3-deoxy-D-manno-octulosonic acid transferase [Candidatus Melainabacteria bacterium]